MEEAIKFLTFVEDNYYLENDCWHDKLSDVYFSKEEIYKIYLKYQ